jgi:hypothetical protein
LTAQENKEIPMANGIAIIASTSNIPKSTLGTSYGVESAVRLI